MKFLTLLLLFVLLAVSFAKRRVQSVEPNTVAPILRAAEQFVFGTHDTASDHEVLNTLASINHVEETAAVNTMTNQEVDEMHYILSTLASVNHVEESHSTLAKQDDTSALLATLTAALAAPQSSKTNSVNTDSALLAVLAAALTSNKQTNTLAASEDYSAHQVLSTLASVNHDE